MGSTYLPVNDCSKPSDRTLMWTLHSGVEVKRDASLRNCSHWNKKVQGTETDVPMCVCVCVCMCVCERERESMVAEIWNFFALTWKDDIASAAQEQWPKDKSLLHFIQMRMGTMISWGTHVDNLQLQHKPSWQYDAFAHTIPEQNSREQNFEIRNHLILLKHEVKGSHMMQSQT